MKQKFTMRRQITTRIYIMAHRLGVDLGLTRDQLYRKPEQWLRDKFNELRSDCISKGLIKHGN